MNLSPEQLKKMVEQAKARRITLAGNIPSPIQTTSVSESKLADVTPYDLKQDVALALANVAPVATNIPVTQEPIRQHLEYNSKQQEFVELATTGKSCVLIGAAGTGKTTVMQGVAESLIQSGLAGVYTDVTHKTLKAGSPGIVICAFTRRAVANIRKRMPADLKANCLTIHALLEFEPVKEDVLDPATGLYKSKMEFLPNRDEYNPLHSSIHTVIIEEASMVSGTPFSKDTYLLFNRLVAALDHDVQFIFLGDIQQLPPVFGAAILGFKMLELPVIELTEVYRQALESPIIRLAHRILSGSPIPVTEYKEWSCDKLTLHNWKKKISSDNALATIGAFYAKAIDSGLLNTDEDIILIPFNKACGTLELNKHLANHIAKKASRPVYEVIAGYNKCYFSVGDKILVDKEDAIIVRIERSKLYAGKNYQEESIYLDYHGYNSEGHKNVSNQMSDEDVDNLLELAMSESDERTTKASHTIYYKRYGSDVERSVSAASEINAILLGYALTIHKAQGSEWRKVFICLHQSHNTMLNRELLYTAVTRAREELYVICEDESFTKGILAQKIKGNSLAEKAEFFKGKIESEGE